MDVTDLLECNSNIILFDGVCCLCSAWVHFVTERDRKQRFKFCQVQSEQGKALLKWCGLPVSTFDTMVYIESGKAHFRSTAFLKIISQLPPPWPILRLGWLLPRSLRDWFYDRIAQNRYRLFGRRSACMMPDENLRSRFL